MKLIKNFTFSTEINVTIFDEPIVTINVKYIATINPEYGETMAPVSWDIHLMRCDRNPHSHSRLKFQKGKVKETQKTYYPCQKFPSLHVFARWFGHLEVTGSSEKILNKQTNKTTSVTRSKSPLQPLYLSRANFWLFTCASIKAVFSVLLLCPRDFHRSSIFRHLTFSPLIA